MTRLDVSLNCWWHNSQRPCPGLAGLCNDTGSGSTMFVRYTRSHMRFADTCCPTHSPCVAFIAFGLSPLHHLSCCPPCHPHTRMDLFSRSLWYPEVSMTRLDMLLNRWWHKLQRPCSGQPDCVMTLGATPLCTYITLDFTCTLLTLAAWPTAHVWHLSPWTSPLCCLSHCLSPHTSMDSFSRYPESSGDTVRSVIK